MTTMQDAAGLARASQSLILGAPAQKAYTPLIVETKTLFTVSGLCLITCIAGRVTTAITVANTVKLQANPTTGTTADLCAATDLGTTDTPAGDILSISGAPTGAIALGVGAVPMMGISKVSADYLGAAKGILVDTGTIEQVTATGADGGILWFLTYAAVEAGATIVAA